MTPSSDAKSSEESSAIRDKDCSKERNKPARSRPIKSIAIGRRRPRRGAKPTRSGQSKALLLEEEGGHEEERSPQGAAGQRRRFGKRKGDLIERI